MRKIKQAASMGLAIMTSLFISGVLIHLFVNNTPTIKPHVGEYITIRFKQVESDIIALLPFVKTDSINGDVAQQKVAEIAATVANAPLRTIAKGTYAKTNNGVTMTIVKIGEMEKVQYTFIIDGKNVVLTVPKDLAGKSGFTEAELLEQAQTQH